ncbi:Mov34/MPN/PAD-1 family protein [Candidatus Uhrbacteria bacterium]|nr:Mov34/MPN/PAD-1 family protein [Candidatus Uhrbacteria bacterium]
MSTRLVVRGVRECVPLYRPAPAPEEPGWSRFGDALGVAVYLSEAVLDDLVAWARAAVPRETMGLLAGRACEDADGPYTLVTGAVRAVRADAGHAHVFAGVEEMAALMEDLRWGWPIAEVVGWWHTHPGYGTRFSRTDEATQATFPAASSVGVVIDPSLPIGQGTGAYLGPRSGVLQPVESDGFSALDAPVPFFVLPRSPGGHHGPSPSR